MKLQALKSELKAITERFIDEIGIERINRYKDDLRRSKDYNDFNVRFANDIVKYGAIYKYYGISRLCGAMTECNANDAHLTTLCVQIAKELNLL